MAKKYYITTAIAYPNSTPHLGHAPEIIQADAFARFNRLLGKDVYFQTGTDEHGLKNWQTARRQGTDIMEFLDKNVAVFRELFEKLNISYDYFVRTTDKGIHYPGAIKLWNELVVSGDIYKQRYKGLYCTGCEAFKTEKELENKKCPNHPTREIETVEEENYFFRLSKYKNEVAKKIESDEYRIVPRTRKNEILSFLRNAEDISFSRPKSSLPWGISVPSDEDHVMYVWCDALSNYITGVGYGRDEEKFRQHWPADVHIIGKDILRFHAAFWPAMLLSARIPLPKELYVHGFILSRGRKMGKSIGNVIGPFEQIGKYGVDQFRFYILGAMPPEGDGEYSEELLVERVNKELAANLGNFCYRVLSFANKNFEGKIAEIDDDALIINDILELIRKVRDNYESLNFSEALKDVLHISSIGNKYFQDNEPWKLIKENREQTHKILGLCVNIAKNIGILIQPVLPEFSSNLQNQLNVSNLAWSDINFELKNHKIGKDEILVRKIDDVKEQNPTFPLNLKIARILDVRDHANADRLYVLQLDLGSEKRQLVAGLRQYYTSEQLKGKLIVLISNLKFTKLRGVESQGMLLAGDDGTNVGLLTAEKSGPGDAVYFEGLENSAGEITYSEFAKLELAVQDSKVVFSGKELKTDNEIIKAEKVSDGAKVK